VIALSDVLLNTVTSSATESRRRDDCVLGGLLDVIPGGLTVTEEVELSRDQCLVENCSTPALSRDTFTGELIAGGDDVKSASLLLLLLLLVFMTLLVLVVFMTLLLLVVFMTLLLLVVFMTLLVVFITLLVLVFMTLLVLMVFMTLLVLVFMTLLVLVMFVDDDCTVPLDSQSRPTLVCRLDAARV